MSSLEAPPVVFFDPNKLSEDGTTAMSDIQWTDDGRWAREGVKGRGVEYTTNTRDVRGDSGTA